MIIEDNRIIMLFKFGEQRWMEKLVEGNISFSCAGNFIHQALKTGNVVQGDPYEGVFARLKNSDPLIHDMIKKLGDDLELIDDHPYVLLRRKSSKLKPIFCLYGYKNTDALKECIGPKEGKNSIKHLFHDEMYSGFSNSLTAYNVIADSHRFAQVSFTKSNSFITRIKLALAVKGIGYKMDNVNYTEFEQDTFFIPPTQSYDELFYKFPRYQHQHECRICLKSMTFSNIYKRYNLEIGRLPNDEYEITNFPFYITTEVILKKV